MLTRTWQVLAFVLCALWTACGIALPLLVVEQGVHVPSLDRLLLVLGCVVLTAAFSHVRFEFKHGDRRLEISPDTAFAVLAAVLLPPPQAALVAIVGGYWAMRRHHGWAFLFYSTNVGLSAGLASLAVHQLVAADPSGKLVLPAALVAAAVKDVVTLVGYVLFEEARTPGGGVALVRNTPVAQIMMLDVGLPVAAVAMAGPFLDVPLLAFVIVVAFEGFTCGVLHMLYREYSERVQNDYLRDTFTRVMPLPVASQLLEQSTDVELGGEQREITVMFCDIRGFTSWAEQNQPDEIIKELNSLLTHLSDAVIRTEGTLDKFTGDGLMAFWGAPEVQPDHALRAMKAVPQMLMRVRELNMRREAENQPPLEVGIGINTGLAMVGNVGHKDRLSYTAVGDTVNLAARLESQTKQFDCPVLVSEATFLSLPLSVQKQLARIKSVSVKGRRDPVRLYTLTSFARYRMRELLDDDEGPGMSLTGS